MVFEQQRIIRLALARIVPNKNVTTKTQFCQVPLHLVLTWLSIFLLLIFRSTYQRSKSSRRNTLNNEQIYAYQSIIIISLPSSRPVDCAPGWCLAWLPVFLPVWCTQPAPRHDTHLEPVPLSAFLPSYCPGPGLCTLWHTSHHSGHITTIATSPIPIISQGSSNFLLATKIIIQSEVTWTICEWHDNIIEWLVYVMNVLSLVMQSRQCVTCLFSRHILFYLSVPSYSYKDFEGYISDIKTGNMGLNVCGAHLSPSLRTWYCCGHISPWEISTPGHRDHPRPRPRLNYS